jgi:N6-L-threonylcarbamoyladenine synthase
MTPGVRILAIESSCDETAAAVVESGRTVRSNRIASQVPLHQRWGGVVPEIASRAHLEALLPTIQGALDDAGATLDDIDAIAATRGPGLVGCLLVGYEGAKAIAAARGLPLANVHHIAGHIYSPFIGREADAWGTPIGEAPGTEPYVALVISGGHSSVVAVEFPNTYRILGETMDDAVGEAYDKVAKLLGLGYPGGPAIDRLAAEGDGSGIGLARPLVGREGCDFSFSGLKTSVSRAVERLGGRAALEADPALLRNMCSAFQRVAVESVLDRAERALRLTGMKRLAFTGGVACNRGLRAAIAKRFPRVAVAIPAPEFCTDNAAMIGGLGYHILQGAGSAPLDGNARGDWPLGAAG